jgi:hypothetical protein
LTDVGFEPNAQLNAVREFLSTRVMRLGVRYSF